MGLLSRLCCVVFHGGHQYGLPKAINGRVRLECQFKCGAMTAGIETLGQERTRQQQQVIPFLNLRVYRSASRKVA